MSKLKITETVLRDSHQSLIATRMTTEEMLPILEKLDGIGYHSLECMEYLLSRRGDEHSKGLFQLYRQAP